VAVTAGSGSKSAMSAQPSRGAASGLITKGLLAIQCETHSTSCRPVHRWPDIARIEILSWWSAIQLAGPVCVYAFLTGQGREENYVSLTVQSEVPCSRMATSADYGRQNE
jgi:hypothetical protein